GAAQRNGRRLVVTLLNAEPLPVRAWQQGASLLDWGFSLPRDAAVGRLVQPGESQAVPARPLPDPGHTAAVPAARHAAVTLGLSRSMLSVAGVGLALIPLVAVIALRRHRRARRARAQ
ncbi:MAG: hypothetical protein V7603_1619, partial [Micromonosporaceae bacterium]